MKVFWSATYIAIPPLLLQEAQFTGWLECLLEVVRRPAPQVSARSSSPALHQLWCITAPAAAGNLLLAAVNRLAARLMEQWAPAWWWLRHVTWRYLA